MRARWLVLADDLTGAADCAIAFGRRGRAAAVTWGETWNTATADHDVPVLSYDADSRGLAAKAAAERHAALLARLHGPDRRLFKKIDSTLRGQPAAETAALMAHLRARTGAAFGVFAPAFPGTGRTTVDGRVLVGGHPLEEAEVWRRDHSYASAELGAVLAGAGISAHGLTLPTVRGDGLGSALAEIAARGGVIAVCDAQTDDDLRRIARASLAATASAFFVGSAGLAHALAEAEAEIEPSAPPEPVRIAPDGRGTLIVVGSLAAASRAGARKLAAGGDVAHLTVTPETLLGDPAGRTALAARVAARLAASGDALVEITMPAEPDMSLGPRLAAALAEALAPVADGIGALAATGGETAAALLARLGIHGIRLADEIEPGVSLGLTLGRLSVPIATKAGAFGDADSLTRIRDRLHRARTEGSLT
ncbi:four-carbon acid sugar kinase family protein [Methylobacterium sp. NEAU 140]|uniref:four-carbon acid sugar kinase family protein n=1 Tax=Methylobacterium sp. NEAU 140 TaxID=3064945 RepID=UPI0027341C68|nr:four-carbon acid sugar kinase family protein [Methylobacterium sp. NEAU 140]MDP4023603.1 four-carbon acid sugar kinase family protein [Methylobacterium sp. NEAU 140]